MVIPVLSTRAAEDPNARAQQILKTTGTRGGLIVHLDCNDGRLTAALRAGDGILVHGLDAHDEDIAKARQTLRALGLYGPVTVNHWAGSRLPYADNTVNLVVTEAALRTPMAEVMRVLVPGGVAYLKHGDSWHKTVKPRNPGTDEWTHFLHDASGNPVAHDRVVGPPRQLQWSDGPLETRSHEHTPTVASVVSSGGRLFYLVDESPLTPLLQSPVWWLMARDAHNGVLLWRRSVSEWWPHLSGWTRGPRQLQRKLVAVDDRVYVTLGLHAPLTALDAATGRTLRVYDNTDGAEEVLCHEGRLILSVRAVTPERRNELARWSALSQQESSPLYDRDGTAPLLTRLHSIESKADLTLLVLDAHSGRVLWRKQDEALRGLRPLSLRALGACVYLQKGNQVVCLDLVTGQERWAVEAPPLRTLCQSCVICANDSTVTALATVSGKTLWTQKPLLINLRDAFVIDGSLWLGGFKKYEAQGKGRSEPSWGPYFATQRDLATGEVLQHVEPENPGHHHRCYVNKATERYILGGRRGTEFIDLESGEVLWNSWARGVCMYGVMPANGLLYVPPHACGCYTTTKLRGFSALAPQTPPRGGESASMTRLQRGPAYGRVGNQQSPADEKNAWPIYRHDAERSGASRCRVPTTLHPRWQTNVGVHVTSPTLAGGKVLAASIDDHRIRCLDAQTGRTAWEFTAGGRVDSAPTLYEGKVYFGSRDGTVTCLRLSDGQLVWRFRAARRERQIVVAGQVESTWPVHGSVLIRDGVLYVTAGRNSYLDGGIDLHRLQPDTGEVLSRTTIYSPDPETHRQPAQDGPNGMPGVRSDLLSCDADRLYLRQMVFDRAGQPLEQGTPHLLTVSDFLDTTWPHRSYWIFGTHTSLSTGCSGREKKLLYGRLIVFNENSVYGYGRKSVHWSNQLQDGPYRIFAVERQSGSPQWERTLPIQVRAMVLTEQVLFVAGPPTMSRKDTIRPLPHQPSVLLALAAEDGVELGRCPLTVEPALDGMAAAYHRLYVTGVDGSMTCLEGMTATAKSTSGASQPGVIP
jgi:outer membrane protein assembly factor BamB